MNKAVLGTVLGAALLGLTKSKSGGMSYKSFVDTFEQGPSNIKGIDNSLLDEYRNTIGYQAKDDLIVFSKLEVKDPNSIVYGVREFNTLVKNKPLIEEIYVKGIKNKGEPTFQKAENLKTLTIRGTFKQLRQEKFVGLNNLENLTIISHNLTYVPGFIKLLPNLKRLRICAPIVNADGLTGMSHLEFLKLDFSDEEIENDYDVDDLKTRFFGEGHFYNILSTLISLQFLYIDGVYSVIDNSDQLECFQNMKKLKQLYINQRDRIDLLAGKGYGYFSSCKELEFLCLFNTEFHLHEKAPNPISITEQMGYLPKLKYLILPYYKGGWMMNDYAIMNAKNFPNLEFFSISNVTSFTFEGKFKNLRTIYFNEHTSSIYERYSNPIKVRKIIGLEKLISLKTAFIESSDYRNLREDIVKNLLRNKSIEKIEFYSSSIGFDFNLYTSKVLCTNLKYIYFGLKDNIALPKDIKKCSKLERIITNSGEDNKIAFNKSLFEMKNLKEVHSNGFVLYNPRLKKTGPSEFNKIVDMNSIPIEMIFNSHIDFIPRQKISLKISNLNIDFVRKIFSENVIYGDFRSDHITELRTSVIFTGAKIFISNLYGHANFRIEKHSPFLFYVCEEDWHLIEKLPLRFNLQKIKEASKESVERYGRTVPNKIGIAFNHKSPLIKYLIQSKYTDEPHTSLQQYKSYGLTQQQYFNRGFDKRYKENEMYIPYHIISFPGRGEPRKCSIDNKKYQKPTQRFNPTLYVEPFSHDLTSLIINTYIPFTSVGSRDMTSLHSLKVSNIEDTPKSRKELQILLDNIFRVAPNLVTIEIKNCPLQKVPDSIGSLSRLTILQIEGCLIKELPKTMKGNKELSTLHIARNEFTDLPLVLAELAPQLTSFGYRNNPFVINPTKLSKLLTFTLLNLQKRRTASPMNNLVYQAINYLIAYGQADTRYTLIRKK